MNAHMFGVHHVLPHLFTLHRLEGSGSDMKRKFLTVNTYTVKTLKHLWREMKTGSRSRYTTFNL